jgi:DNA modification methylase
VQLVHGDCLAVLPTLAAGSVNAVVTDPPYELAFMGKRWDQSGVAFRPSTWEAVLRVLRPGGYLLAFGGTRTYHRLVCAVEDAGFEVRDCLMWVYASGFPKGRGCLKPAWEPILLCRRPGQRVLPLPGLDGCRVPLTLARGGKKRLPGNGAVGSGGVYEGGYSGDYDGPEQPHPGSARHDARGRWPANVVHDGSGEVLETFAAFGETNSGRGVRRGGGSRGMGSGALYAQDAYTSTMNRTDSVRKGDAGTAARFFFCAKASRAEREAGLEGMPQATEPNYNHDGRDMANAKNHVGGEQRRVERGLPPVEPRANNHPCVKPLALLRWLCRLVTPPGGTVLDPFLGSGTTAVACALEGFDLVGIEKDAGYVEIARRRVNAALAETPLFPEPA